MEMIKSLEKMSFDSLFDVFNEAFRDYEMQLNKDELHTLLIRRGFVPELSFGAFIEDKMVAFTFNGIGLFNSLKTAYDTGTGTVKDYRGKGLATRIFTHSIPFLKKAGVSQYLLEVLQHNTPAVNVYQKIGFNVSREFNYFVQRNEAVKLKGKCIIPDFHIKPVDLSWHEDMTECWDFMPSWQNSFEAIARNPEGFIMEGAFLKQKFAGYCIFDPESGDIAQLAVNQNYRRKGIASALLGQALKSNLHNNIKAINTQVDCESLTGFLESNMISLKGKQFEMIKTI
ncbi:MAG TPA: GNAT family N-acetyltransferase [Bacteroidales bacterium]|nr:GNAT family N-acetyltransferase [Bacteroidales bacterium]